MPSASPSHPRRSASVRRVSRSSSSSSSRSSHGGVDVGASGSGCRRVRARKGCRRGGRSCRVRLCVCRSALRTRPILRRWRVGTRRWVGRRGGGRGRLLVVADDVFVEDGDVAAGDLQVEVAEQGRADVDRQAVVDQVGGEQATEVVRGERSPRNADRPRRGVVADAGGAFEDGAGGMTTLRCGPIWRWNRNGSGAGAAVRGRRSGWPAARRPVPGLAADELGDDVEQLRRDRDDPFAVGLGRGDHQQGDDLAVGALVLAEARWVSSSSSSTAAHRCGAGPRRRPSPRRLVAARRAGG